MLTDRTFLALFCLLALLAILHHLGLSLSWYYYVPFFDLIVHTLGGAWVGGMAVWLFAVWRGASCGYACALAIALAAGLTLGILWEVYEVAIGAQLLSEPRYIQDTSSDLVADLAGALAAAFFVAASMRREPLPDNTQTL